MLTEIVRTTTRAVCIPYSPNWDILAQKVILNEMNTVRTRTTIIAVSKKDILAQIRC